MASLKARFRARLAAELADAEGRFEGCGDLLLIVPREPEGRPASPTADQRAWLKRRQQQGKEGAYLAKPYPIKDEGEPEAWPADLRPPLTVDQALDAFRGELDAFAADLAADIEFWAGKLVKPELRKAITSRPDLVDRWPILDPTDPKRARAYLSRRALVWSTLEIPDLAERFGTRVINADHIRQGGWEWPGEVAPLAAAEWARLPLNKLYPVSADRPKAVGDMLAERVQARGVFLIGLTHDNGRFLPSSGIALLLLLEHECRIEPAPFEVTLISVDKPAVEAMSGLAGSNPSRFSGGRAVAVSDPADDDRPVRLEIEWHDGTQLELDLYGDTPTLEAVGRKYGPSAVQNLEALCALTWAGRKNANELLWWWPDEHLELVGRPNTPDNRASLLLWLGRMQQATLRAHFHKGPPSNGPLVAVNETAGAARLLRLHSALYRGVATEAGELGTYWWAMSMKVIAEPPGTRVHVLAPVFGQLWRQGITKRKAGQAPTLRIGAGRLMERVGIHRRKGRARDPIAARKLRDALEAGKRSELVGDWELEGGDLDLGTGVIHATPGEPTMSVLSGSPANTYRPAWIPATGGELRAWIRQKGLNSKGAASRLGAAPATVRRWTNLGGRPLPPKARKALRELLWSA